MVSIRRRIERLERLVVPQMDMGKELLEVHLEERDRCDIALQRALDEQGLSLNDVRSITFSGGPFFDEERDLRNHPEWEVLKKLQWEEYLRWKEELSIKERSSAVRGSPGAW